MKTKKMNLALALAALAISSAALAEETSTTSVQAVAPKLLDNVTMSYLGYLYGPTIGEGGSRTTDGDRGVTQNGGDFVNLDSQFKTGYKLNKDVTVAGTFRWIHRVQGQSTIVKDAWLSAAHAHAVQRGNFNSAMDVRLYLPTSFGSQDRDLIAGLRFSQNNTLAIGDLTAGIYTFERVDFTGGRGNGTRLFYLYAAPNAAYQISKTVAGTLWVDLAQYETMRGDALAFNYDAGAAAADVELGVSWDITPSINVNPYVQVVPTNMRADSTTLNMILSAKLL
jgi:hypothetical protein